MINPARLLGATFACECGKTHSVPVRELVYSETALRDLPAVLARNLAAPCSLTRARSGSGLEGLPGRICLVADARTYGAAGEASEESLRHAGAAVQTIIVPDNGRGDPRCDDVTRDALAGKIEPAGLLLAVGSGVINDLVKWISSETSAPYAVVATAASMNGYASANIAPSIRGIRRVIAGTAPLVILAVPSVIENAPFELTASGLGDVLAKPVSVSDWKLNQVLFGDYYCELCAELIRELEPAYISHPEDIRSRKPSAIRSLFDALVYSGVSMTMADTSFPASGGEHLVSHALDMMASARGLGHDYHGRQVGLGTIFACALYERVLGLESPEFHPETGPIGSAYWGSLAPVVEEEYELKRQRAGRALARLKRAGTWDEVRAALKPGMRKAADIKRCLSAAGAAHRVEHIGCSRERFLQAVLHCHQVRERYTVIDLARATGVLPAAAEEITDEYLT